MAGAQLAKACAVDSMGSFNIDESLYIFIYIYVVFSSGKKINSIYKLVLIRNFNPASIGL